MMVDDGSIEHPHSLSTHHDFWILLGTFGYTFGYLLDICRYFGYIDVFI